jgi:hypothetical protein
VIILDYNQVALANLMVGGPKNINANEDLLRHMILNSIRMNKVKFEKEFGELVIACDATSNWRKQFFPYYKANRKKNRQDSGLDWNEIFRILNAVRDELAEFFPYPTVRVEHAEADDVIATLCHEHGRQLGGDPILILSGDKDFQQLQKYSNVSQYDPTRKKWIKCNDPETFLKEHILKGDTGDGIPNVLSSDDTFVANARQKPLRAKKIDELLNHVPEELQINWHRNALMIDLDRVPQDIKDETMKAIHAQSDKGRDKLFNYFIKYKLKNLTECISEF